MNGNDFFQKVKILTIHFGTNHGSVLQAYALSTYVNSLGYDTQVIDYVPERYKLWNALVSRKRGRYPLPVLLAYYPLAVLKSAPVRSLFERFLNRNLPLTRRYDTNAQLKQDPPAADVYITGSDQVWNNDYNGADDLSYFLDFAPDSVKKLAYAASFGKAMVTEQDYVAAFRPLLASFDGISVRERDAKNILQEMQVASTHVVDPVFLLSADQWGDFGKSVSNDAPYTLVYVMDGLYGELIDYAQKIKEQCGNRIYVVSFTKIKDKRIDACFHLADPRDFIGLIRNADAVVTNSFHGTAFSVLFQKRFITIGKTKYNSRMNSLLGTLSLSHHFVPTGADLSAAQSETIMQRDDIDAVDEKLQQWIQTSKEWLQAALDGRAEE